MPIRRVAAGEFAAIQPGLIALLHDAVLHGSSLGFLHPISGDTAAAYWADVAESVASGQTALWVSTDGGRVVGSVQLAPSQRESDRHRAQVQNLLVMAASRRKGIARALIQTMEAEARRRGLHTLVLDTELGCDAEPFCRALGYEYAGSIPDFAATPDGVLRPNAIYYKLLLQEAA